MPFSDLGITNKFQMLHHIAKRAQVNTNMIVIEVLSFMAPRTKNDSTVEPYGHLTSKVTSPLRSPWVSPKLYSTVQRIGR